MRVHRSAPLASPPLEPLKLLVAYTSVRSERKGVVMTTGSSRTTMQRVLFNGLDMVK